MGGKPILSGYFIKQQLLHAHKEIKARRNSYPFSFLKDALQSFLNLFDSRAKTTQRF